MRDETRPGEVVKRDTRRGESKEEGQARRGEVTSE